MGSFVLVELYRFDGHFVNQAVCGRLRLAPSHGENRGSSPLGSANDFKELSSRGILEGVTYGINTAYPLMIEAEWWSRAQLY